MSFVVVQMVTCVENVMYHVDVVVVVCDDNVWYIYQCSQVSITYSGSLC